MSNARPSFAAWTVDRPIATLMLVSAVVVFGLIAARQLPTALLPELSYPTLTIQSSWPGAAPEEVEDSITRPVEELVRTIEGLQSVESSSRASVSEVRLRFRWRVSMDVASQRVRERLELVDWPDGAERAEVLRYDPALEPTLRLALVGDRPGALLYRLADTEVRRRLERVPGVAMIRVHGGDEEVVQVALRARQLARHGLRVQDIEERLRSENINVAGGRLEEEGQEILVRTVQQFRSLEDIEELIIHADDSQTLRLADIATISLSTKEGGGMVRIDGRDAVELSIFREADANLVDVATDAHAALDEVMAELPDEVELVVLTDSSRFVRAALQEVQDAALYGAIIATLVLLVSLRRLSATVIIALSIPLSILATLGAFRILGVGLNLMSLGGLALGIGMLVDNSIVVLEAIVRRREEGASARDAAIEGTGSVAVAVTSSTLTTLAVFVPVVFLDGVAGQLFGDLAMAVVLSLVASLIFALTFVPMLAGRTVEVTQAQPWGEALAWGAGRSLVDDLKGLRARRFGWLLIIAMAPWLLLRTILWAPVSTLALIWRVLKAAVVRAVVVPISRRVAAKQQDTKIEDSRLYHGVLRLVVAAPRVVIILGVASFIGSVFIAGQLPRQLLPTLYEGRFDVQLKWPVGTSLDEAAGRALRIERELSQSPAVARVASFIGPISDGFDDRERGEHIAWLTVVVERSEASAQEDEATAQEALREILQRQPAVEARVERPTLMALAAPVQVELRGHDLDALREVAATIETRMRGLPGIDELRSSARPGFPELRLEFDRERLALWGLDAREVAEEVRRKIQGVEATQISREGVSLDIHLALDRADVGTVDDLLAMDVGPAAPSSDTSASSAAGALQAGGLNAAAADCGGARITLGQVASVVPARGPAEIRRLEGQRAAVIAADVSLLDLAAVAARLGATISDIELRSGQTVRLGGQAEEMAGATAALGGALWLAIFLVVVVLASTFESLRAPALILGSLPLALSGVVAALILSGEPLSVLVVLGVIVLVGIVVNNAIVLVDSVQQLSEGGREWSQSVVDGALSRFRPVLLTAATTILGLVPLILTVGEGAEIRRPLALVLVGGLTSGTVLTLVVIPALLLVVKPFRPKDAQEARSSLMS